MRTARVVEVVRAQRLLGIIRADEGGSLIAAAQALAAGGLQTIEFSYTSERVLDALRGARKLLSEGVLLGVGTVLDPETARACIRSGAQFIVSPIFSREIVEACRESGVASIPGAATPTEILAAWQSGADLVKVFPAAVYGPRFFRDLRAPLPGVPLIAVGGITVENAADYLEAGAVAVGLGAGLVGRQLASPPDFAAIAGRVRSLLDRLDAQRIEQKG